MRENLLDNEQENNINNINNNNLRNVDEKVPLKKEEIHEIAINIENNLIEGNDNNKDDNKEDEYPIRINIGREGEEELITIIKTKFKTYWVQNYKEKKMFSYCLNTFFFIALPLLTSLNLIGIFKIISVMNALFKVLSNSFSSYFGFEDKEDDLYNFYSFYFKESINEGIEFDLIETMSFFGMIFYGFYGYKISSLLFMIPNSISIFLIYMFFSEYNDESEQYNLLQISYLFICYALLFIGVGSSALLSQQMLIDKYENYISFLKQINIEEYQNNEYDHNNNFIFICVTSIIGSLINYIFDIIISRQKYIFDHKYNNIDYYDINNNLTNNNTSNEINNIIYSHDKLLFFVSIIAIYGGSIILSIIFYIYFKCYVYKDFGESQIEILGDEKAKQNFSKICGLKYIKNKNEEISKDEKKKWICKIFGYIYYLDKINKKDKDNQGSKNDEIKEDNNKKRKTDVQKDNEVSTITKLPTLSDQENKNNSSKCILFIKTCKLIDKCFCKIFLNLKLLSNSLKNFVGEIICNFICKCCNKDVHNICPFCFCCECCCSWYEEKNRCCNKITKKVEDKDYEQNEIDYTFCVKVERNHKWFDNFIKDETQFKFLPLLVEFFLIQLITIVFDIKAEENIEEGYIEFINSTNISIFILVLFGILFLFFAFTYLFGLFRTYLHKKIKKEQFSFKFSEVTDIILKGTIGIVIVNSLYSLSASIYCLTKDLNNIFLYIPILMNKCYFFVFSYHCTVYTDNEERIDYFSSATLLSIYLFIWDLIIEYIIKKIPIIILLFFQITLSLIIFLTFIFSVIILIKYSNNDNCIFNYIFSKFIEINENKNKNIKEIKTVKCRGAIDLYDSPPLIGLKKTDSKNYANSILQCLSQTEPLTNYILKKTIEELNGNTILGPNNKDYPITNKYYELIHNLWPVNEISSSFSPKKFIKKNEENNMIELNHPGAYKEFIIIILNNIHYELKKYIKGKEININQPKDKYNKKIAFIYYYNDFLKESSIISELFFGHIETISSCFNCQRLCYSKNKYSYSYEKFNSLIFPLEEIKYEYKKNELTLDDCFKYNQKVTKTYCKDCHYPSTQASYIFLAPKILILILDRGKENLSDVKLKFKETENIIQSYILIDKDMMIYNLYAVLTHIDQNHFVALCKSPANNKWYRFDDEKIVPINDLQKEVINFGTPDILFYQQKKEEK